jgi:hypothetical protein
MKGEDMPRTTNRQLEALAEIAEIARRASDGGSPAEGSDETGSQHSSLPTSCQIKALPTRLHLKAAQFAARINPVNSPLRELRLAGVQVDTPEHLMLLTAKYWGLAARQFTVSFIDDAAADLRARIVSHMNAWSKATAMSFVETDGIGDVRISFSPDGYWSYLGTDTALIPKDQQTMNLQDFSMDTPESEYHRVVRHETGHTLGFAHEHMRKELVSRIDPAKAYPYFLATQGWDRTTVDQQVLTALDENSIMGTPADQDSIMCYQLPGQITFDGLPIRGGLDIDASDYAFAALLYPKAVFAPSNGYKQMQNDWDPAKDVALPV